MQALILAGGKGTRLRPLTVYTPKPIVPICNRPFLLYQIDTLKRAGITDITLSLSYQPEKIEQIMGDGSNFGVKLKYTVEPQPMGTAGAYKFAEDLIREAAGKGRSVLRAHSSAHVLAGHRHARAIFAGSSRHAGEPRHSLSSERSARQF